MCDAEKERLQNHPNTRMKNIYLLISGMLLFWITFILSSCSSQISTQTPDLSKQPIPPSMKGYEIYSWKEERQWVFKLITGTNRQKSIEEIMSDSETNQDDTWTNIKISGVDDLKMILENFPKGESLIWMTANGINVSADQVIAFEYPPEAMIEDIRAFCEKNEVDLVVGQ